MGGSLEPAILQALLVKGSELDIDTSNEEVVITTQTPLRRSNSNDRGDIMVKSSTQDNVIVKQKSSRRSIFSAMEKLSASRQGQHSSP